MCRAVLLSLLVLSPPALADVDEIGIFRDGLWFLDANGNTQPDGGDTALGFGLPTDTVVWGDWNGDGHDEVGIYRNGLWFLDTNGNNRADGADTFFNFGLPGDVPVAGDWNGWGFDQVGIFRDGLWFLDTNANFQADGADTFFGFGLPGDVPIVWGCVESCGYDLVGIFRNGLWFVDLNGNFQADGGDSSFLFGQAGDVPVLGDWTGLGLDQPGIFRDGLWFLDTNYNGQPDALDTLFFFGLPTDRPVCGAWGGCGDAAAGDCGLANGTPGCADENCCMTVCATDPFCCETEWDTVCAAGAALLCGATGIPNILGKWSGPGSVTLADCGDPADDGPYLISAASVNVYFQDGGVFDACYEFFWPDITGWGCLSGTIDEFGGITATGDFGNPFNDLGAVDVVGTVSGGAMDLFFFLELVSGDTCTGDGVLNLE